MMMILIAGRKRIPPYRRLRKMGVLMAWSAERIPPYRRLRKSCIGIGLNGILNLKVYVL